MLNGRQLYSENGVLLSTPKIYAEESIALLYKGLLAESGADRVFARIGYGKENIEEYKEMDPFENGFRADIQPKIPGMMNICFKDSADNWDNNSGENYTFKVMRKKKQKK